jgi:molybdopterin synthase catalytic subunit
MERQITLIEGPLPSAPPLAWPEDGRTGAVVDFYGVVRGLENGDSIPGLTYEAYTEMAHREFHRVLNELEKEHPCHSIEIIHSTGFVPTGQPSLFVRVRAAHRGGAFLLAQGLIDRMKQDVPIWKRA